MGVLMLCASCSDGLEQDNPQVDGNEVSTDMMLSLQTGYATGGQSRMTATDVQQNNNFKGVQQLKLFAFKSSTPWQADFGHYAKENIQGYQLFMPVTLEPKFGDQKYFFQPNVRLALGTNRFIGFGSVTRNLDEAYNPESMISPEEATQGFQTGLTVNSWNFDSKFDHQAAQLGDFYFGPRRIFPYNTGSLETQSESAKQLLCWLNRLFHVTAKVGGKSVSLHDAIADDATLREIYDRFTTNVAGSYRSVRILLEDVYRGAINYPAQNGEKYKYKPLANALAERILTPFGKDNLPLGKDNAPLTVYADYDILQFEYDKNQPQGQRLKCNSLPAFNFPENLYLPDGAVILSYVENPTKNDEFGGYPHFHFSGKSINEVPGEGEGSNQGQEDVGMPVGLFAFPAELLYRVDTPIGVSETTHESHNWNTGDWNDLVTTYTDKEVKSNSASVVLKQPLKYMTCCLETKAYLAANELPDHKTGETGKNISVTGGFPITAVLVGMQHFVGWDGKRILTPPELSDLQYIAYDRNLAAEKQTVTTTKPVAPLSYTLVFESEIADFEKLKGADGEAEGKRTKENVLLELENTAQDFFGVNGQLIPKGGRFYLIGELDLKKMYDKDQNSFNDPENEYRIFEQGKTTKVTLKISTLAGAYNYIPDLRNPSLKIGLQVDCQWQNGIVIEDDMKLP